MAEMTWVMKTMERARSGRWHRKVDVPPSLKINAATAATQRKFWDLRTRLFMTPFAHQ
ncbi:hypothetical protein [Brucella pseudogrignonensis]|uniref:hypothetical protein n=1 Tax=Brucella pseudogrignonensis TaxID=419475 RepID=UPI0038CF8AD8